MGFSRQDDRWLTRVVTATALGLCLCTALLLAGCATHQTPLERRAEEPGSLTSRIEGRVDKVITFTAADFRQAAVAGRAARKGGDLPEGDRWAECFDYLADRIEAGTLAETGGGMDGVAQLAMKVHINKYKLDEPIDANCAQVVLALEKDGVKLLKSLGLSAVPGGAVAGKGLDALGQIRGLIGQ